MPMSLAQLVASSANIHSKHFFHIDLPEQGYSYTNLHRKRNAKKYTTRLSHSMPDALQKEFGTIYYNNKVVIYDEDANIVEIRMMIGTKTETAYSGFHAVRIAVYGVKGQVYNSIEELYWDKIGNKTITDKTDPQSDMKAMRTASKGQRIEKDGSLGEIGKERFDINFGDEISQHLTGSIIPVAFTGANVYGQSFGASGKIFYLEEPITINNPVRVSCSCSDYHYTIAWYNDSSGAHLGTSPAPYPNRSGTGSKPVRNTGKNPGLCKHLMVVVMLLMNGGIIDTVGSKNFHQNRDIIMNRAEKLNVPRKLAEGNKLNKMYEKLTQNAKDALKQRNLSAGYKASYIPGYEQWRKDKTSENARAAYMYHTYGIGEKPSGVMKGVSKANYLKQAGGYGVKKGQKTDYENYMGYKKYRNDEYPYRTNHPKEDI